MEHRCSFYDVYEPFLQCILGRLIADNRLVFRKTRLRVFLNHSFLLDIERIYHE